MNGFRLFLDVYQFLLCRRRFYKFNAFLHSLTLRGIGVLNYESMRVSGELDLFRRLAEIGGDPLVLDVGAHKGEYSRALKNLVPGARIFAFEPHPGTYRILEDGRDDAYTPIHAAVSDEVGTCTLYDRAQCGGSEHASIVPAVMETLHHTNLVDSWTVPCITIDAFLSEHRLERVHFLKVDTEGNELRVLQGARAALAGRRIDLIQLEFNSMNALSRAYMRDFRELLVGYTPCRLMLDGPVMLSSYDPAAEEIFAFQNLLFVSEALRSDLRQIILA